MLPDCFLLTLLVVTWIVLTAVVRMTVQVTQRVARLEQLEIHARRHEQEVQGIGEPVPPLALTTSEGHQLVLGQPPVAPAVVLALSGRCPPCQPFRDQLTGLLAWLREHGVFPVLALPTGEPPDEWPAGHAFLTGNSALSALGLTQFPSALLIDREGVLRGRAPLRSPDELLEITSIVLFGLSPTQRRTARR